MEVGPKFRGIGRSNLPGYEKGRRKRALALEHKAAIRAILTQGQADVWEYRYGSIEGGRSMSDTVKDQYEKQIEQLEKRYEREKEAIEDGHLPKYEKKSVLDKLKRNYKAEKERLKEQRDAVLESVMYE